MSDFDIRRLHASDVDDFRLIRLRALATAPIAFGSVHAIEAKRPLSSFAERLATSAIFGAYRQGRIVGMIGLRPEDGPKDAHKSHLWGFFVDPSHRGKGLGAALLAMALDQARQAHEQVMLSVVARCADAAALYIKSGFVRYGVEPRALKLADGYDDEILMALLFDRAAPVNAASPDDTVFLK